MLHNELGLPLKHSDTEKIFINLRRAQSQIIMLDIAGCSWISTTISNAIAYISLLENEIFQLKMQNEILEAKDEEEE